jgi:hypothetical protein
MNINDLLITTESSELGLELGNIFMGSPGCSDNVTLLTNDVNQAQPQLFTAKRYTDRNLYQLQCNLIIM